MDMLSGRGKADQLFTELAQVISKCRSGVYRNSQTSQMANLRINGDIDTLQVYRNITLHPSFDPAYALELKYADFAIMTLRNSGFHSPSNHLSPELLHQFTAIAEAREELLQRGWLMGYGNEQILINMIFLPELGDIYLHLVKDRKIEDIKEIEKQAKECISLPSTTRSGAL